MTQQPKAPIEPQDPSKQEPGTPTPTEPVIIDPRASLELAEPKGVSKDILSLSAKYPDATPRWLWSRLKERPRQVIDLLAKDPDMSASEAGRQVGIANGPRIAREYRQVVEWRRDSFAKESLRTFQGWLISLEKIAKAAERDSDKLRAHELIGKVQGWLSDRLQVDIQPAQVRRELLGARDSLRQLGQVGQSGENTGSTQIVDAQVVPGKLEALEGTGNRPLPMAGSTLEDPQEGQS